MMNKLVSAAVVGGAALAVGILPGASLATAATAPTPIPVPTNPAASTAPATPSGSVSPTTHAPGHQTTPGHTKSPTKGRPGHAGGTGSNGGAGGTAGTGGGGKPVAHRHPTHSPGTHKPGTHKPVAHKPVKRKPVTTPIHQPTRPPVHKPVVTSPVAHPPVVAPPVTHGMLATPHIVGGKNATNSPWAVQVSWDDTGFECSGTAVAPQWVLTAGHCAGSSGMTVLIGSNQLGQGTKDVVDDKVIDRTGDMALLHLADPVGTAVVQLADQDPDVDSINQIYGWGKTGPDSGPADQLKTAKVKVTSVDCKDGVGGRAICSTGLTGSAFYGDSGGPEMAGGVEVGVCSTGDVDTKTQQYASVAANRDWIRQVANV
jgi:hypothetical protein